VRYASDIEAGSDLDVIREAVWHEGETVEIVVEATNGKSPLAALSHNALAEVVGRHPTDLARDLVHPNQSSLALFRIDEEVHVAFGARLIGL
jgi:hypothetical protein